MYVYLILWFCVFVFVFACICICAEPGKVRVSRDGSIRQLYEDLWMHFAIFIWISDYILCLFVLVFVFVLLCFCVCAEPGKVRVSRDGSIRQLYEDLWAHFTIFIWICDCILCLFVFVFVFVLLCICVCVEPGKVRVSRDGSIRQLDEDLWAHFAIFIWICDCILCLFVFVFVFVLLCICICVEPGKVRVSRDDSIRQLYEDLWERILPFLFEFVIAFCVCLCLCLYLCCYVFVSVLSLGRLEWAGTALSGNLTRISERILPFSFEFVIAFYVCLCLYLYLCCYVFVSVLSLGRLEWAGTTLSGNFTRISERILPFRLARSIFHLSSPPGCISLGADITSVLMKYLYLYLYL